MWSRTMDKYFKVRSGSTLLSRECDVWMSVRSKKCNLSSDSSTRGLIHSASSLATDNVVKFCKVMSNTYCQYSASSLATDIVDKFCQVMSITYCQHNASSLATNNVVKFCQLMSSTYCQHSASSYMSNTYF